MRGRPALTAAHRRWIGLVRSDAEGKGERCSLCGDEAPRNAGLRLNQIEAVECPWDNIEFARDAGRTEPIGVGKVFVVEKIECPNSDPSRWQCRTNPHSGLGRPVH